MILSILTADEYMTIQLDLAIHRQAGLTHFP